MQTEPSAINHILYVEDLETDQILLPSILPDTQYRISIAANGQEALNKLKDEKFDLVLMDIEMPVMNGIDATRHIRNELHHSHDDLPIVALSIHNNQETRNAALEVGIDDFIAKPFDHDELAEKIRYWLNRDNMDPFAEAAKMFETQPLDTFPVIDPKQIESFLEFIGIPRTRELIEDFIQHYDEKKAFIFAPDTPAQDISAELHAMASISGNVGLSRFSMACRYLMSDIIGDVDRQARLNEVQALYEEGLKQLQEILKVMDDGS